MAKVGEAIAGAALIAGAIVLDVTTAGAALGLTSAEISALSAMGASMGATLAASGVAGLLAGTPPGQGSLSRNPAAPWQVCYGQVKTSPTLVYIESNGGILANGSNTYDKCVNQVAMVACHPIKSVDQVRLNGKAIPLGPGGSGAQSTEWTYTPSSNQGHVSISSISRSGGLVTLKLSQSMPNQNGSQLSINYVADHTFNGTFTVTQPNPADATTFTYLCGGPDTTSSGGYVLTTLPSWSNRVHVDRTSCLGNHTSTFPELLSTSVLWTPAHRNLGRASVYLAYYADAAVFGNGQLPTASFVVSGKNDIFDPRTGTHGYTTNAALVIADYLTNKDFGFGLNYETDIPLAPLIAAANLCDEDVPLAAGGTEKRYTINMAFNLSQTRGAVLQDMLNACAGRLTIVSGQYNGQPGVWIGPSLSLDQSHLIGPIDYKAYLTSRDACNGVKGSFVSPTNNWESGDFPPFYEGTERGYTSDRWLAADNGVRIFKDVSLHATTSSATAQRLAKIELERTRREGRLTLHCNMAAYPAVAGDVIEFTYPRYGWVNKTWEVISSRLIVQPDANGGAPTLGVDLDLAESDSTVYDFSSSEELAQSDTPSPAINNGQSVTGPMTLVLESGAPTSYVGADGIALPRILASWVASPDASVQSGGFYRIEYQKVGDTQWIPAGDVGGTQTQIYIDHVVSGWAYNVQVQAFRGGAGGAVGSGWAQAGPITVSATQTALVASNVTYSDGTPVSVLQPNQAGADQTSANIPTELLTNGSFESGLTGWTVGSGSAVVDTSTFRLGKQAIRMSHGRVSQPVYFYAGHTYLAQAWVKTNGSNVGSSSLGSSIDIPDTNGYVRVIKTNGTPGSVAGFPGVLLSTATATDWTLIQVTFTVSTTFLGSIRMADDYAGQATGVNVWYDGLSLTDQTGGADVTSGQTIAYAGLSESIINNGSFILGNLDGWFVCEGSGSFSYAPFGNGQSGLVIGGSGQVGVGSPTFSVIPGQKYRLVYTCMANSGSSSVYLRLNYSSTYLSQIKDSNRTGLTDFQGNWTGMAVAQLTSYSFDWTCPAGIYFASAAIYEWNHAAANLYLLSVSCVPYAAVGEWGIGNGNGTAGNTIYVGGVASTTIASVIPNGAKLYLNSGSRTYSITAV